MAIITHSCIISIVPISSSDFGSQGDKKIYKNSDKKLWIVHGPNETTYLIIFGEIICYLGVTIYTV